MSSSEEEKAAGANGEQRLEEGEDEGVLAAAMEQLAAEGVRALHARVEAEWDPVLQSACQTAAVRALWASAVRDPAAGVAGRVTSAPARARNAASLSQTMYHFYHDSPDLLLPSIGFSQAMLSQIGDPQAHFGLLSHPQNLFEKLRRLPRSVETNPEDGTPCRRLYLVEASASPDDHTTL
uniref:Uncharacterized protein n=1 Tax=Aegilops tauschii TaxID=37682 RepID=M8B5S1_AEGTA